MFCLPFAVFAFFVGTGLGGGWVAKGGVHEGCSGFAGEVGHMTIPGQHGVCGCGQLGCLETVASKRGVARMVRDALEAGRRCELQSSENLRSKEIETALRNWCAVTVEVVQAMGQALGWAMNVVACVVNPTVFILGGGVSERLGNDLIPLIERHREDTPFVTSNARYEIKVGQLGGAAVARGAAQLGAAQNAVQ